MSTKPQPIRVALLGAGIFARKAHLPNILSLPEIYALCAVYSRSQSSAQRLRDLISSDYRHGLPDVYHDKGENSEAHNTLDDLLIRKDIDVVVVGLPIATQPIVVKKALALGKHVLSEKPIATSVREGEDLVAAYESLAKSKPSLIWNVAENWRCESAVQYASHLVTTKGKGAVRTFSLTCYIETRPDNQYVQTGWRTGEGSTVPGGFLLDGGVHWIAMLRSIVGCGGKWEIGSVSAFGQLWLDYCAPLDSISAIMKLRNRLGGPADGKPIPTGTFNLSFAASGRPFEIVLTVICETGALQIEVRPDSREAPRQFLVSWVEEGGRKTEEKPAEFDGIPEEFKHFGRLVRGTARSDIDTQNQQLHLSPKEALADVAVIEALLESVKRGGEHVDVANVL